VRTLPAYALSLSLAVALATAASAAEWGTLSAMHDYHACFGLDPQRAPAYKLTMLGGSAAGNVFHPREQPRFDFQLENLSEVALKIEGHIDVVRYAQLSQPGDNWFPRLVRLEACGSEPLEVNVPAKGWVDLTVSPRIPETKGGYALIVDLRPHGRHYLTSMVRTFKPTPKRVQYPKQSLEEMPPEILERLGVQAIRWGVSFVPKDSKRREEHWQRLSAELKEFHEHHVTVLAEIGTGGEGQPLGLGRPHLDDKDVMLDGKQDLVWLPEHDDDYQQFVYRLASEFGWPKGPITAFDLWNEPWEGLSISGWAADIPRYRDLYQRMGDAVLEARSKADVDVLVGGCDSSANTWDKLFPDGNDRFLSILDFCSIHYQGLSSPALYPEWHHRTAHKGRVLIWDTESWVANSDDRFPGVVAANRAAGYDRSMGTLSRIAVSTLSHGRIAKDTVRTAAGDQQMPRVVESRPLAAVYGAVQHFIGDRPFKEILFKNGLPWVFVFDGLQGNPDDGVVVVVGDLGSLFEKKAVLFETVRPLDERKAQQKMADALAAIEADGPQRAALRKQLESPMPWTGVTLAIDADGKPFGAFDSYGNPIENKAERLTIALNDASCFLRADPKQPGSFAQLLEALRQSTLTGLEPVEIIAFDMIAPIETAPTLRLRLTSMHNQPIEGRLTLAMGELKLAYPTSLTFEPREQKWVDVVVRGKTRPENTYPLSVRFDAGPLGIAEHDETMRVNWIGRQTITVDGKLDDWRGALPQTIRTDAAAERSFEETMWLPFEKLEVGEGGGLAVGYVAYDAKHFYFAARIADDTPSEGTVRFATRDDDAYFYPAVSYSQPRPAKARKQIAKDDTPAPPGETVLEKHVWPDEVRRFSYRMWPDVPSSMPQRRFDNVLIAFNALPPGEDGWLSHLPGRMPKFIWYKTTDYEYALNRVAQRHGGGAEIWRLLAPGMPYKHFFPRQPKHPLEGAVENGKLVVVVDDATRIVECAIPWSEISDVERLMKAGAPVKFSFRVNHDTASPDMELGMRRSAAEGISPSFHPNWQRGWPNEIEFGWEK
jgi:hypothetical protein